MQIKLIKPINFLFFRTDTTLSELASFLPVGQQLFTEAVNQGLAITGPIHWHYLGFLGDATKQFTLEIALPVSALPQDYDGKFHVKRTEPFKCVSLIHDGGWNEIPSAYETMFGFIKAQKLTPASLNREIYINVDFNDPSANVTEIQLGIL